jgi:hypothetical protein
LCTNCGLTSCRPVGFVRARRSFICGGCKEMIPLDRQTVLDEVISVPDPDDVKRPSS